MGAALTDVEKLANKIVALESVIATLVSDPESDDWVSGVVITYRFGLSKNQIEKYRNDDRGLWLEGVHYQWNQANNLVYNVKEISKWMGLRNAKK